MSKTTLADQDQRDIALSERKRDVIVLAGAGSGKTTLLTQRYVSMVAPASGIPVDVTELAAVTFTRRAAGELRNRIRAELLKLVDTPTSEAQGVAARVALSRLNLAFIGTIHSFADSLLRLRPIEAGISPQYEIVEDEGPLIEETVQRLHFGVTAGDLGAQWTSAAHTPTKSLLSRSVEWINDLQSAGVRLRSRKTSAWSTITGIEEFVAAVIKARGGELPYNANPAADFTAAQRVAKTILKRIEVLKGSASESSMDPGVVALVRKCFVLKKAIGATSLSETVGFLSQFYSLPVLKMGVDFPDTKKTGWPLYRALTGGVSARDVGNDAELGTLSGDQVLTPLVRSLLSGAASAYPVVLSLYEDVKRRHEVLDQTDILLRLRQLLREREEVRIEFQNRFKHIFIDECQDTDPFQTEIFLDLAPSVGRLTIIGDPKQSIYRFRRADIAEFARLRDVLLKRGAVEVNLSVNFRSRPELIEAYNTVFPSFFGLARDPKLLFDPNTGHVSYLPLKPSPKIKPSTEKTVRFIRVATGGGNAGEGRPLEAQLVARHIKWLLSDKCSLKVRDDESNEERRITGSDIAVLARAMTDITGFVTELKALGLNVHVTGSDEYASGGLVQRYILALNAIADRSDGIGMMALHEFPFSSVTPLEVAVSQSTKTEVGGAMALAEWIKELRIQRNKRPVLHTALDLIENSMALRILGVGLNADEDLANIYRLAYLLDDKARSDRMSFDEVARWARTWLETPPKINSPAQDSEDCIRVGTIHQSKGLEFPIVVLFDGFGAEGKYWGHSFLSRPNGKAWSVSIGDFSALFEADKANAGLQQWDEDHHWSEQRRLHYVATTRAKDFLIIPAPEPVPGRSLFSNVWGNVMNSTLAHCYPPKEATEAADFLSSPERLKGWKELQEADVTPLVPLTKQGMKPRRIVPITQLAHDETAMAEEVAHLEVINADTTNEIARTVGGADFGTAVHRGIYLALTANQSATAAGRTAVSECKEDLDESRVAKSIQNALNKLKELSYLDDSWKRLAEVPFICELNGVLARGIIDLVLFKDGHAHIVDFKTDLIPSNAETQVAYKKQLDLYATAIRNLVPEVKIVETKLLYVG